MSNNESLESRISTTKTRGRLFIISAPSGGGKGTLIRRVLKTVPNLGYSVSFTTRPPRAGDIEGRDYFFVSRAKFERMIDEDEFLEYATVHGNYYGTSRRVVDKELKAGRDVILEIDVQGADIVRAKVSDAVSVFILPPSFEVLRERLVGRGTDSSEVLAVRLKNARSEAERYKHFDYVVINDQLETAATQLAAVFYAERARRARQEAAVEKVLFSFNDSEN
jgi:guanylate kinase